MDEPQVRAIAICGQCGRYGQCKAPTSAFTDKAAKENPWRCTATRKCQKRTYG